jgi:hypothetical protein
MKYQLKAFLLCQAIILAAVYCQTSIMVACWNYLWVSCKTTLIHTEANPFEISQYHTFSRSGRISQSCNRQPMWFRAVVVHCWHASQNIHQWNCRDSDYTFQETADTIFCYKYLHCGGDGLTSVFHQLVRFICNSKCNYRDLEFNFLVFIW